MSSNMHTRWIGAHPVTRGYDVTEEYFPILIFVDAAQGSGMRKYSLTSTGASGPYMTIDVDAWGLRTIWAPPNGTLLKARQNKVVTER